MTTNEEYFEAQKLKQNIKKTMTDICFKFYLQKLHAIYIPNQFS